MSYKRLRVANVIEEGKVGGPQIRIANVAHGLSSCVDTVVIMPRSNSEAFQELLKSRRVNYKSFSLSHMTKEKSVALRYILFSWYEIIILSRYFKNGDFDLIHVSGGAWQFKGVIAGKVAGCKVIWHLNDTSMPNFIRFIFSMLSWLPDAYVFASNRTKDYYSTLMKSNVLSRVIPAPVDCKQFSNGCDYLGDEELIRQWEGKRVIGMVANINPIKGVDVFVKAANKINELLENCVFVVIGPVFANQEKYFNKIQELCASLAMDNVEFVGGRDDVRPLLKRMDLYVCSSFAESSPISVWEALSMGKAVVSTDVGDVGKYIVSGECGFIVPVGDYAGLAKSSLSLLCNDCLRGEFQLNAASVAINHLDLKICVDSHYNVYDEVCGRT